MLVELNRQLERRGWAEQKTEQRETRDLTHTPIENGVEKEISARPQRSRRPPAWLKGFVSGRDLDQSLSNSQDDRAFSLN